MAAADPLSALLDGVDGYIAGLDDKQFADLVARVRKPATGKAAPPPAAQDSSYPAAWKVGGGR